MKKIKLKFLHWPVKSSDFNLIELVWSILDRKLMSRSIYNKVTLRKRLEEEWKGLSIELCRILVDSMPERLEKCLQMEGKHFN